MFARIAVAVALFVAMIALVPSASMADATIMESVRIISPNGGEEWETGSIQTITWEYGISFPENAMYSLEIFAITPDGYRIYFLTKGFPTEIEKSFQFQIPNDVEPDQYQVRLSVTSSNPDVMTSEVLASNVSAPFGILHSAQTHPSPPANVWLLTPILHKARNTDKSDFSPDTTVVTLGIREGFDSVISADIEVSSDQMIPVLRADLDPTIGQGSWMISQNPSSCYLRISVAGVEPLTPGQPFLRISFLTTAIVTGMISEANFQVAVRLNEGESSYLQDTIRFEALTGDVSLDGEVSAFDAAIILRWLVGLSQSERAGFYEIAEVSGNNEVTAYDVALILRYVAGLITSFPVDNMRGGEYGLPGGGGEGTMTPPTIAGKRISSERAKVSLGEFTGNDRVGYTLPIIVDDMSVVMAGQLEIGPVGDGASIEPTKLMEGYLVETNRINPNLLVSFAGIDLPQGGGKIFLVKFKEKPISGLMIQVRINEDPLIKLMLDPVRPPQPTNIQQKSWGQIKASFAN